MPNENLGWLILFASVGAMYYVGLLISHFHFKHNLFGIAVKSLLAGMAFIMFYTVYASFVSEYTIMDLLTNSVPITEVKGPIFGVRSVFPAHLVGYVLICGGVFLLPFSALLKGKKA